MKKKNDSARKIRTPKSGNMKLFSIKTRVVVVLLGSIVLTVLLSLYTIIPNIKRNITNTTQNYMLDLTLSYGRIMDQNLKISATFLSTNRLQSLLSGVGLKDVDSSYFYVVSMTGKILYHPEQEKVGQSTANPTIEKLVEEAANGTIPEADTFLSNYNDDKLYISYYFVDEGTAMLILTAEQDDILSSLTDVTKRALISCTILGILLGLSGFLLIGKMTKPIITISKIIEKFANMDLEEDERLKKISHLKDETGVMGRALISLREALVAIISDIKAQSTLLFNTSESLSNSATETANNVQNVERAVSEIATGASNQATETQKATDDILLIGNMLEDTSSEVSSLLDIASNIKISSDTANVTLHELDIINQRAIDSINIIYEQTHTTNDSALKIKEATSLISSIADETNLLSLNASIEAARAGEAGRGFAVVASQIQKLAEQSNKSARQIDNIIFTLLEDSQKAVETMESVKQIMMQQNENVTKTGATFSQVQEGIAVSVTNVNSIADHTNQLNSARISIVDVVQNLTAIAEQNAASTQETSAAVLEVTNVMQNISKHASQLQDIASSLETNVDTFKI